jgi:hypothetical protein
VTTYMLRSAWTSTAAAGVTLTGSKLRGVAIHWPGTTQDAIGDPGQAAIASRLRQYRDFHLSRGWRDIGYNFAVDQAGRFWMLRSTRWKGNLVGAHCASAGNPDANYEYVGVLLIIGDRETPSSLMVGAFRDWYHNRFLVGWPGRTDVRGHGQVPGASTECPGARARTLIASGDFTGSPTPPPPEDWLEMATKEDVKAAVREVLAEKRIRLEWDGQDVSFFQALSWIHFNAADGSFVGTIPETSSREGDRGRDTHASVVEGALTELAPTMSPTPEPEF